MACLQLALFGGFEARLAAGQPVTLARHKVEALLALLALRPGQFHRRDKLAALLWPDAPGPRARHSLRQALAELRLALAPAAPCLLERRDAVGLDATAVAVDVPAFERLLGGGVRDALEEAVSLYRGDLLEGIRVTEPPFEEWLMRERERLREMALDALARLLAEYLTSNALAAAVQTALRLLALDPLQESVHRTLMRLYVRQGRRGAGLRQYQACLELLRRELGAAPESETRQVYLDLLQTPPVADVAAFAACTPTIGTMPAAETSHPAPMLGRDTDLAELYRACDEARRGGCPVVAITGEAGIGKTRLVGELVTTLSSRNVRALLGRAHETESDLPFGLWIHAFRDGGVLADVGELVSRAPWLRAELSRLFPELAEPGAAPSVSADRAALFEALGQVMADLAARSELLLVLEDVHCADDWSLRLLAYLARRVAGGRVAMVLSARVEEMPGATVLRQVLEELEREGLGRTLALAPLARDASLVLVRALAGAGAEPAQLDRLSEDIWRVSEGNPFMIVETVRALQEGEWPGPAADVPLPRRVHDTITGRLDRLTDRGKSLAGVAAAIGRQFDFAVVQKSAGLDAGDAAAAVEELVGRRILHVVGERLEFTHEWIRRTVYERLLPPVRPVLHASIARALEALHVDRLDEVTDDLAYHYSRANEPAKAVASLRRFADAACARYAFEEAIRALDEALDHADRLAGPARVRARIDVTLEIAFALSVVGRFEEILDRLEPLRETVAQLADPAVNGRYLSRLALTESVLGRHARAEETAHLALAEAGRSDDVTACGAARYVLAVRGFVNGEAREGHEHAQQAIAVLERGRDHAWLAQACWILGCNLYLLGEFDAAVEAESRMEAIAERVGDRGQQATAAWSIAWFEVTRGEIGPAREAGRRALERSPDTTNRATAHAILAMVETETGDASRAIPRLEASLQELGSFRLRQAAVLLFLAEAYRLEGDLAQARDVARRVHEMSRDMSFVWAHAMAERALGRIALDGHDVALTRAHLDTALRLFAAIPAGFERGRTHLDLALAALATRGEPLVLPAVEGDAVSGRRRLHRTSALEAAAHIDAARRLFTAARAPAYLARAERLAADLEIVSPT